MKLSLVTAGAARGLDEDLPSLEAALKRRSVDYAVVDWDDPLVDWSSFDLTIIRSTWDYTTRVQAFLSWAEKTSGVTRLANPYPLIAWNTDKHYLRDLAAKGCATVPTSFVEVGKPTASALDAFLLTHDAAEFVVKPSVGAGSRDTQRYRRADVSRAREHVSRLTGTGRSVVLQPYLASVDQDGETALIYFRGRFSHAIRKGPLLRLDQDATRALFAPEHITSRVPSAEELGCAAQTLAAIPHSRPLYARVDLIRDAEGQPRVLELELTEPSLFFDHSADSADRFVTAALEYGDDSGAPEL